MRFGLLVVLCCAVDCAAATASGRNWRITIDSLRCEAALVAIGMHIGYLGPKGAVEAPVSRLVDAGGRRYLPKSLVWTRGSKLHAEWLSRGGLRNVQSDEIGELQVKFDVGEAGGELKLEFGDISGFSLTSGAKRGCARLLRPDELKVPRVSRASPAKERIRVYRRAYPCSSPSKAVQTVEAEYPPYLPRQLLVFGRGYLPSAREIELPMGRAPAQSYVYSGPDDLKGVEDAARRTVRADFPELLKSGAFAFDWGAQRGATGNEIWSVGIYDLRACGV